jgi:WD40 repeat protein
MPTKHCVAMQLKSGNGGNILTVNSNKQRLYCFNSKPGLMCEYDMRKPGDTVNTVVLSKEEVTAVATDPVSDALIVGFNDGVVKIYDEEKLAVAQGPKSASAQQTSNYVARETINAFTNIEGKKKPVSQVKVHPNNGGLFASTTGGMIKLLRLQA